MASVVAVTWLGSVLADATLPVNEGLTVDEGSTGAVISNTLLLAEDDTAPGSSLTFTLVSLPVHGSLNLNGSPLSLPGEFTQADVDANLLTYDNDGTENASDSFDFTVATSGGSTTVPQTSFAITVNPVFDQTPVLNDATFDLPENSAIDTSVGTVTATDADFGDSLSYTITNSLPEAAFSIVTTTGQIKVSNSTPLDLETNPTFTLTVEVKDSGNLTDSAQVTINLLNVNEAPVVDPAGSFNIAENTVTGTAVTTITATDVDASDVITFSITAGNTANAFAIGASSGEITVADGSLLDYDIPPTSYTLTIKAEDIAGAFDTEDVVINLTNVNEPPVISPSGPFNVSENTMTGTPVTTVSATDVDASDVITFSITAGNTANAFTLGASTGVLSIADGSLLDYDTPPTSYTLTIKAEDIAGAFDTEDVVINLTNINEPPSISETTLSVVENSANTSLVGLVPASDEDANDIGNLTFAILPGNGAGAFAIANDGSNNGRITVANSSLLDYETKTSYVLNVIVTDTLGLDNTATVTINLTNVYDVAPNVSNATFFVVEGSANGVAVGTVTATDPELSYGDILTFAIIGGNTGTVFAINSTTGQITVPDTSKLDADTMPTFNLTVRATDRGGKIDTGTITINVSPLPITYLYLPITFNNYPPIEPNNHCGQAYAIGSGTTYEFTSDDVEDWYAFTLNSPGNLVVTLSNFEPSQGQLVVYGGVCGSNLVALQNNGNALPTKVIDLGVQPAGTYYIRVYSVPVTNTTYNLRVN
ncbi:MAG: cadherin domain-containing protein [Ardenticatenaceae bacterium]|nr:cadherin domain-containing protein [Ardenticatenaceae bacterium]